MAGTGVGLGLTGEEQRRLGEAIRRHRVARGFTQQDLSADLAAPGYLSRIEAGLRAPGPQLLQRLASRLGLTAAELLGEASGAPATLTAGPPPALATAVAHAATAWLDDATSAPAYARLVHLVDLWRAAEANDPTGFGLPEAVELARRAHAGQVDKQGRDYFSGHLDPIGRALLPFGTHAAMAGYLHDLLEDTTWTADQLRAEGVPDQVVDAVVSVTRIPSETYEDLIERASSHPLGRLVKLADNTLNVASNPGLAAQDPVTARRMLQERYLPARDRLLADLPDGRGVLTLLQEQLDAS